MATKTKSAKAQSPATNGPPPAPPAGDVLTLAEAAAFLRVDVEELKRAADAGRVPGRAIGTEWRFIKEALVEWLSQPELPGRPATNRELADHVRATALPWSADSPREAEDFLAGLKPRRKAARVGA